jgi:hypothetical protein
MGNDGQMVAAAWYYIKMGCRSFTEVLVVLRAWPSGQKSISVSGRGVAVEACVSGVHDESDETRMAETK